MLRTANMIQKTAFVTLFIGALGDWVSTKIGLSLGLAEGNRLAAFLMSKGIWIQSDFILISICFLVPYLVYNLTEKRAPKSLFLFPLMAGLLKLLVSIWNMSIII